MKKIYYTDQDIKTYVHEIIRALIADNWRPDYIVGLTRGGLYPAVLLSHYLKIPMYALSVQLRDSDSGPESNLWMAEDAFNKKNILVVDDINDSGATIQWIQRDWQDSCHPADSSWPDIWNQNVRFAVIVNNESSDFKNISYSGTTINKLEDDVWIVFPYEQWW